MSTTSADPRAELFALLRIKGVSWPLVSREAQRVNGLERLVAAEPEERSTEAAEAALLIRQADGTHEARLEEAEQTIASAAADGIGLVTVLDADYPTNLRTIFNAPPMLFYRGRLLPEDIRAVAVVGTREPSELGRERARKMAAKLAGAGVTVLSGLARGIDTEAHEATLAVGGRTIAVLGSGIRRIYPKENEPLAERIVQSGGAIVSQFWPDTAPTSYTFPRRNVVTSGMGQGTVVIEASRTSGAKMQARLAVEHGKLVFLIRSLVAEHKWAADYVAKRGAITVDDVDDVLRHLSDTAVVRERTDNAFQLALAL